MLAMAVVAAERAVQRLVARLDHAVAMLCMVRADDSAPAVAIQVAENQVLTSKPRQDVVQPRVAQLDRLIVGSVAFLWRDAQRLANLPQRVLTLWMELDQPRRKVAAPALHVDAAGDTAVADGVRRARIGVASISDGLDRRAIVALLGLITKCIAPLVRPLAGFQHPRRV